MKKTTLPEIRKKIDEVDSKLLNLLNQRAGLALEVGKIKKASDEKFYIPNREREILARVARNNKGPLPQKNAANIFSEILHSARALQAKLKVSYFGPEATFTHQAAIKNFGRYCEFVPAKTIGDVFQEVEKERADYGVVPIENSTEGIVNHTFDLFIESDLNICAELNLRVEECLLSKALGLKDIKKVYSHSNPLAQCRGCLELNLPRAVLVESSSTSEAAKIASREKDASAIASSLAADLYGLRILAKGIEDSKENYTRFLVIGSQAPGISGNDKTSIMFSIKDRVGALHEMLAPFRKNKINLTKIESRPTKRKAWEYIFFIDMSGHIQEKKVRSAIDELSRQCVFLKILGSYPKAE